MADIPEEVEAAAVATICLPLNNGEVAGLADENDGATAVHKLDEESTEDQVLEEMVTEGGIVPP